jgi:glycosyltransferase involved in cell wall biosynthesis
MGKRRAVREAGKLGFEACVPLITLGVTCFNAATTIRRAVLSAIRQDWPNKEIIVVDDASNERTGTLLRMLHREFPEIRLVRHERNKGYPAALNTILGQARGEFIAIFDDDDASAPERLRAQWSRITAYEQRQQCSLILCYSNRKIVKLGGCTPTSIARAIGRQAPEPHGYVVADYLFGDTCYHGFVWGVFGSCTLMARRETFLEIGPFDEAFRRCAEWDMAIRAACRGAHFIAVDEPLVTQYKTGGAEKAEIISLKYALMLRSKYKHYLVERGFYWASFALARSNFHGGKGRLWKSRAYAFLACLLSPVILSKRIAGKLGGS